MTTETHRQIACHPTGTPPERHQSASDQLVRGDAPYQPHALRPAALIQEGAGLRDRAIGHAHGRMRHEKIATARRRTSSAEGRLTKGNRRMGING